MSYMDPATEADKITAFIRTTFQTAGFGDAVVGLSGGVDSAVSCALAAQALGLDHVFPILMPYDSLNTRGVLDAVEFVEKTNIPVAHIVRIDIKPAVDQIVRIDPFMDKVRKGNIMARVRMTYLFDAAKKHHALVIGTENKSEHELGYFTRFGDEASDVEPILHLYKTQVYELAKHLHIPESIIQKAPSADLWPEQTDENELGFSYEEADNILFMYGEEKKTKEQIINTGSRPHSVEQILHQLENNKYKHLLPHKL